jgi:hypothetical protein
LYGTTAKPAFHHVAALYPKSKMMDTNNQQSILNDVIPDKSNINRMVNTAWHVLSAGLFPAAVIDDAAGAMARAFIKSFINREGNPYTHFAEFCQRILMVRYYMKCRPAFEIRYDINGWLNPSNKKGFAGTAEWFATLKDNRSINPIHKIELKAFPEAILELAEEPTPEIFHYWNNWLAEKKAVDIQKMFMMVGGCLAFRNAELC